jgi:hypothetical protein
LDNILKHHVEHLVWWYFQIMVGCSHKALYITTLGQLTEQRFEEKKQDLLCSSNFRYIYAYINSWGIGTVQMQSIWGLCIKWYWGRCCVTVAILSFHSSNAVDSVGRFDSELLLLLLLLLLLRIFQCLHRGSFTLNGMCFRLHYQ